MTARMPTRRRLDAELVRRGMASSRTEAQRLIDAGGVTVGGRPFARAATMVSDAEPIVVTATEGWASRAGGKLAGALDTFALDVRGRRALDIGASTGGFTDVLLARGAASVVAVDVGYGQMIWRLRTDPRVTVVDRTNARTVDMAALGAPFEVIVVDVSFISVRLLAAQIAAAGTTGSEYVVLVKPQFEVGREAVGKGGIVRDAAARTAAITSAAGALLAAGLGPMAIIASPVVGAQGNQEYLLHLRHGEAGVPVESLAGAVAP